LSIVGESRLGLLTGIRVLLVEDHADTRDILYQVLAHEGALVTAAASAREAIPTIPLVDIVVTDVAMPGESGVWLSGQVMQSPRRVPIIAVTGFADQADVATAPFARVLRKPVDPWRLCTEIRDVLGQREPE
jgi:CheY-like chemotaxis protein